MDAQEALARRSEIVSILMVCDMNNLFLLSFACLNTLIPHVFSRLERAKKLQEQREKEMVEKQQSSS